MALNPADIATVSRLLDEALALEPAEREPWLAALPAEHQRHADALRGMLAQEARLGTDPRLESMPKLTTDEAVAHADDRVGPYRLLREIGRGGMGSVWLAERADGAYKRQVALKLPRLAWGAGLAECMAREREIGMLLEHPNIARLYDAGVDERGRPFLALEFVDGQPIDAWCEAKGLKVRERLRLFVQVVKAVAYAHGRLVVHRDLKPSNVLVTPDGQAHLLDFGIAKLLLEAAPGESGLTQEQGRVLTPHYASPEQVAGEAITVQADVYSLGVLLYELLTGVLPIEPKRASLGAVEDAILQGDAPAASSRVKDKALARALRGELDAILAKAMQREPARRYATADAMALDIERHLNGETVSARPDSVGYRLSKAVRRHWVGVSAVTAVLVAVFSGSGVAIVQARRASDAAERAGIVKAFVVEVFNFNSGAASNNELRKMPAQTLVEHGAKLIETRFPGQPQLQAELHGVVAGIFVDMGAPDLAVEHATKLVATLTATRADEDEQAKASMRLARALFEQKRFADATTHAQRAISLADAGGSLQLDARLLVARAHLALGQTQRCEAELKTVEDALERKNNAHLLTRALATNLRARLLERANRFDDGLVLHRNAIEQALVAEGPQSDTAASIRLALTYSLVVRNRQEEGQAMLDAALAALRARGGASELKAAMQESSLVRQMSLMGQMDHERAKAAIQRNLDFVEAQRDTVPPGIRARIEYQLGVVEYIWGEIEASGRLMDRAELHFEPASEDLLERWELATWSGAVAMEAGQHERAERLLGLRLDLRKQMGHERMPFAAYDHAYVALNLGMQGRFAEAMAVVSNAPQFGKAQGDSEAWDYYSTALPATRARLLIDSGNFEGALASLPGPVSEPMISTSRQRSSITIGEAQLRGEALCGLNRREEGLRWLRVEIEHRKHVVSANEPILARDRAVAGLCALAAGHTPEARQLAGQARAAFTAQPGVSPYYKAPLLRLERALGLRLPPV
jgi:eukaryotic-like serine/threonine-protein kinase